MYMLYGALFFIYRRHLTDFQRFLNLKAVEGYPEQGGDHKSEGYKNQDAENAPCLSELAAKLNKGERTIQMMQWLDENAPEEVYHN